MTCLTILQLGSFFTDPPNLHFIVIFFLFSGAFWTHLKKVSRGSVTCIVFPFTETFIQQGLYTGGGHAWVRKCNFCTNLHRGAAAMAIEGLASTFFGIYFVTSQSIFVRVAAITPVNILEMSVEQRGKAFQKKGYRYTIQIIVRGRSLLDHDAVCTLCQIPMPPPPPPPPYSFCVMPML